MKSRTDFSTDTTFGAFTTSQEALDAMSKEILIITLLIDIIIPI